MPRPPPRSFQKKSQAFRATSIHCPTELSIMFIMFRTVSHPFPLHFRVKSGHFSGTKCAFVGKTGCGKSSTLLCLLRFLEPRKGRILLGGHDASKMGLAALRKIVGLVPQARRGRKAHVHLLRSYSHPHSPFIYLILSSFYHHFTIILHQFLFTSHGSPLSDAPFTWRAPKRTPRSSRGASASTSTPSRSSPTPGCGRRCRACNSCPTSAPCRRLGYCTFFIKGTSYDHISHRYYSLYNNYCYYHMVRL